MVREVDFIEEAQNLDDFVDYLNATHNQAATAPKVYHQYSTRRADHAAFVWCAINGF